MAEQSVKIAELRLIVNRILDHIEQDLHISAVPLKKDYYWTILGDRYDMSKEPAEFGAGQLYDDWEFLTSILEDKDLAVAAMLEHASHLLRYVGEEIGM